jgi:hypothetical protein
LYEVGNWQDGGIRLLVETSIDLQRREETHGSHRRAPRDGITHDDRWGHRRRRTIERCRRIESSLTHHQGKKTGDHRERQAFGVDRQDIHAGSNAADDSIVTEATPCHKLPSAGVLVWQHRMTRLRRSIDVVGAAAGIMWFNHGFISEGPDAYSMDRSGARALAMFTVAGMPPWPTQTCVPCPMEPPGFVPLYWLLL